jgi:hypothetical protein
MRTSVPPELLKLLDACGEVFTDNKMPFFPAYTDHGAPHVASVLEAAERLIPQPVWRELLEPADAAVFIGAVCLHDLALHIREPGFQALIADASRFKPLAWFDADHPQRPADRPWPELWQEFRKEAQHFTRSQLDRLLGPTGADVPQIAFGDGDAEAKRWTEEDRLLIGEFIRRHHARLAHEIAIYGFPGIADADFPELRGTLPQLADAIGVTARSHNENLRVALEYFSYRAAGSPRPDGAVLPYLMGVLRIADYFQIQRDRATPLLLHLREPQSPQSVQEWEKHQAINTISWGGDDPLAVYIQASPPGNLRTHLQLAELIDDLQAELDVTTAVLSETYGDSDLEGLRLAHQRVRTNLEEASLHDRLSFVPRRASLRSAEDLFRLVVSDLYGDVPAVAGRELLQNSVDAVRELSHWESRSGPPPDRSEFRDLPADVLVEVQMPDEDGGVLRVLDRGIGMTPSVVIDNFLTAGATFSAFREDDEDLDAATAIEWMKAGKFGVGAFAAFLLGPEVRVTTRHVTARRGVSFVASLDDDLVQLDWDEEAPFGTEITVPFTAARLPDYRYGGAKSVYERARLLLEQIESFYELSRPGVRYRLVTGEASGEHDSTGVIPTPGRRLPDTWRSAPSAGFDAVLWRLPAPYGLRQFGSASYASRLAHNGIVIHGVDDVYRGDVYRWADPIASVALKRPNIAVFDTRHRLGVSLNRYQLVEPALPCEEDLLRSIGADVLAHALVSGESQYPLGEGWGLTPVVCQRKWVPLLPDLIDRYADDDLCVLWYGRHAYTNPSPRFMGAATDDPSWPQLPHRAALVVTGHRSQGEAERDRWGLAVEDVEEEALSLARRTGRSVVAGVVVRNHPGTAKPHVLFEPRYEAFHRFSGYSRLPRYLDREPPRGPSQLDRVLTGLGEELVEGNVPACVGLTVLRRTSDRAVTPLSPLGSPWATVLDDGLRRTRRARLSRKSEIAETDRQLRILFNKWERIVARRRRPKKAGRR